MTNKVFVYFNLHKNVFSLQSRNKENYGLVLGHADHVILKNAKFVVRPKGRERVLKEKKKNVHAGVVGCLVDAVGTNNTSKAITYNPYKYSTFVVRDTEQPIEQAEYAVLRLAYNKKPIMEAY